MWRWLEVLTYFKTMCLWQQYSQFCPKKYDWKPYQKDISQYLQTCFVDQQYAYMHSKDKRQIRTHFEIFFNNRADVFCILTVAEMLHMKIKKS